MQVETGSFLKECIGTLGLLDIYSGLIKAIFSIQGERKMNMQNLLIKNDFNPANGSQINPIWVLLAGLHFFSLEVLRFYLYHT